MTQTDSRKFEIIRKDITRSKLTIACDRITLKIPNGFDDRYVDPITKFAQHITGQITQVANTLRGTFEIDDQGVARINLKDGTKEVRQSFEKNLNEVTQ